jgi:hypothetical protein
LKSVPVHFHRPFLTFRHTNEEEITIQGTPEVVGALVNEIERIVDGTTKCPRGIRIPRPFDKLLSRSELKRVEHTTKATILLPGHEAYDATELSNFEGSQEDDGCILIKILGTQKAYDEAYTELQVRFFLRYSRWFPSLMTAS